MSKKKTLKFLLRLGISLIFIIFLLHNADVLDTLESLYKANHMIWIFGIILYIAGQLLSAYKWKLLAQAAEFKNKLKEYIDYYFIGMFFNLFLPTTVGGDITKCFYLSRGDSRGRKAPAVYTVLMDRAVGVAVIVWMGTVAMLSPAGELIDFKIKLFMILLSLGILIVTPFFPAFCMQFLKKKKWARTMLRDIKVYWNNPKLIIKTLYWSLLFHLLIICIHLLIGGAMGLNIPPAYYFIVYPMSAIAGFIPFAFNGIGPREATYVYFFSLIGIKQSSALAFGIFWFGIVLCSSLIGGLFYIKGKHTPPPEEFDIVPEDDEDDNNEVIEILNEDAESTTT